VYGPVRTVVWQGSVGNRRPYADQTALWEMTVQTKTVSQQGFTPKNFVQQF